MSKVLAPVGAKLRGFARKIGTPFTRCSMAIGETVNWRANLWLWLGGFALIVSALIGFFQGRDSVAVSMLTTAGVLVLILAVFELRIEGVIKLPGGGEIPIRAVERKPPPPAVWIASQSAEGSMRRGKTAVDSTTQLMESG